jgi:hypothetical protein
VVYIDSLHYLLSIVAENGYVPQCPDVKAIFLCGEHQEIIYMHLPEGYRDSNKFVPLKRYIYGLKPSRRE